jgi:hypothetical protein
MRGPRLTVTWLGAFLLVLGPLSALAAPAGLLAQDESITCADFNRQEAAQALLDADDRYAEALDPDGNGIACDEEDEGDETPEPTEAATDEATEEPKEAPTATPTATPTEEPTPEPTATPTEAAEEEPERTSSNPLRWRLGSNQADFEDVYGEPDGEPENYPNGYPYEIDGFAEVDVFYHRGYVVHLRLVAPEDDAWSQREADRIGREFLPTDWVDERPIVTADGDLLIPGHSAALEPRFSQATYERYGARGEQGDAYLLFRLNDDNAISSIEIGLGNRLPDPPEDIPAEPREGDEGESDAEDGDGGDEGDGGAGDAAQYLQDVRAQFDTLVASIDEFGRIISDPEFADDQELRDRLAEILLLWAGASEDAAALEVPEEHADLQAAFQEYAELLSSAAIDLTIGLSAGDETSIQAGADKLRQAIDLQANIEGLLAEAGA